MIFFVACIIGCCWAGFGFSPPPSPPHLAVWHKIRRIFDLGLIFLLRFMQVQQGKIRKIRNHVLHLANFEQPTPAVRVGEGGRSFYLVIASFSSSSSDSLRTYVHGKMWGAAEHLLRSSFALWNIKILTQFQIRLFPWVTHLCKFLVCVLHIVNSRIFFPINRASERI